MFITILCGAKIKIWLKRFIAYEKWWPFAVSYDSYWRIASGSSFSARKTKGDDNAKEAKARITHTCSTCSIFFLLLSIVLIKCEALGRYICYSSHTHQLIHCWNAIFRNSQRIHKTFNGQSLDKNWCSIVRMPPNLYHRGNYHRLSVLLFQFYSSFTLPAAHQNKLLHLNTNYDHLTHDTFRHSSFTLISPIFFYNQMMWALFCLVPRAKSLPFMALNITRNSC